jgi:hypothetical protein
MPGNKRSRARIHRVPASLRVKNRNHFIELQIVHKFILPGRDLLCAEISPAVMVGSDSIEILHFCDFTFRSNRIDFDHDHSLELKHNTAYIITIVDPGKFSIFPFKVLLCCISNGRFACE